MRGTIVIAGSLAQKPRHGGHTWVFLQYLVGFKRLGWDVLFLDRLGPGTYVDAAGRPCSPEDSLNLGYVRSVMEQFGLGDSYAVDCGGKQFVGLSRRQVAERTRGACFLLNVMGFLKDEEILTLAPRRVFLDIDPGFGQMWRELGLHDLFAGHDDFVTIGENIGRPGCSIPTCGLPWVATPQPVVLEHWPPVPPHPTLSPKGGGEGRVRGAGGRKFTSVASWRGAFGPVEYEGKTYGLRVHEFRKFASLPRRCDQPFQLALDIHPSEMKDLDLLRSNGWSLVEPVAAAGDPWTYQTFIQGSLAEFMVAKNMYVQTNSGWLSDRSLCYLASGKPVLAQDTGLKGLYPTGEGLLTFNTLEEAVAGVEEVTRNHARHARAARILAEDYFDSDKVLSRLLARLGAA